MKLYLIPGTGTDKRLFTEQFKDFPDIIVPEWLPPLGKTESVVSYAKRMSAAIDASSAFIVGGVSLGGMIAQEIALILKPAAVLLISTCSDSKSISLIHRLAGKLMRRTPNFIVKLQFKIAASLLNRLTPAKLVHKEIYAQMLKEMSPELVRWQSGAATEWKLSQPLSMPVFHIHGTKDKIIPLKNIKADVTVPGGHLINVTEAGAVNAYIKKFLNGLQGAV